MFKFIFKTIAVIVILIIIVVVVAFWKGGEPFRWIGKKTESAGRAAGEFGDMVDGAKETKKKTEMTLKELKESISHKKDKDEGQSKGKDETINNRKKPE
ncbi:MAG: hypothetical protein HZC11_05235 [Nitrospirae bacterium]|nr:hypothetical protein [Nitrospirota bacterium]